VVVVSGDGGCRSPEIPPHAAKLRGVFRFRRISVFRTQGNGPGISDPYLNTETLEKKDGHIPYKTFYDRINQPKVLAKC